MRTSSPWRRQQEAAEAEGSECYSTYTGSQGPGHSQGLSGGTDPRGTERPSQVCLNWAPPC